MAEPHTTHLITAPKPVVTRYNRLVLYTGIAAVALVVCTYLLVMREQGRRVASTPPMHLTSLPTPLVTEWPHVTHWTGASREKASEYVTGSMPKSA